MNDWNFFVREVGRGRGVICGISDVEKSAELSILCGMKIAEIVLPPAHIGKQVLYTKQERTCLSK